MFQPRRFTTLSQGTGIQTKQLHGSYSRCNRNPSRSRQVPHSWEAVYVKWVALQFVADRCPMSKPPPPSPQQCCPMAASGGQAENGPWRACEHREREEGPRSSPLLMCAAWQRTKASSGTAAQQMVYSLSREHPALKDLRLQFKDATSPLANLRSRERRCSADFTGLGSSSFLSWRYRGGRKGRRNNPSWAGDVASPGTEGIQQDCEGN